jgi:hypothetical protein
MSSLNHILLCMCVDWRQSVHSGSEEQLRACTGARSTATLWTRLSRRSRWRCARRTTCFPPPHSYPSPSTWPSHTRHYHEYGTALRYYVTIFTLPCVLLYAWNAFQCDVVQRVLYCSVVYSIVIYLSIVLCVIGITALSIFHFLILCYFIIL